MFRAGVVSALTTFPSHDGRGEPAIQECTTCRPDPYASAAASDDDKMKRHVLFALFLLLITFPILAEAPARKPQRQTWYEQALNHINPENKDFGAAWEERKRAFVIQLENPYFQYGLCVTGALILLLTITVAQYTSHRRALVVAAKSFDDVLRHDHY